MNTEIIIFIAVLCAGVIGSVVFRKLTLPAASTGAAIAGCIFAGVGWTGIFIMGSFFVLAVLATSWNQDFKQSLGVAEKIQGLRTISQVAANGLVAGLLGLMAFWMEEYRPLLQLLIAGSFSSATADTISSELGTVYGKKFYNILSLRKDKRGENGVVSIEGLVFGIIGSNIIAALYVASFGWSIHFLWIIIAGTLGNLTDSILGAALERRSLIGNNAVNFLNTVVGALTAMVLYLAS
ncbi:DUF92 domain-containing protein [Flavihumibacter sp. ZG627]|uniref:DUF92 domain-containing protein n=1 Tax=Flavihumibacter sp. ZG627 TaxID=1463156 RepID=UPI00057C55AD|nr:DUF92 domain-containing protein [Flavihumibacter sp. ZG627]KIC89550.1 membrane protein [Flavihumibacter sp. ZG627]